MAGLTPANARWFALDAGNETPEEKAWLDDSAQLLWENIHLGNFDAEGFESALDMVVAGQFAMYIDEDQEEGGLVFQHWSLAEVSVGSRSEERRVGKECVSECRSGGWQANEKQNQKEETYWRNC